MRRPMAGSSSALRGLSAGFVLGFAGAALVFLYGCWTNAKKDCEYPGTEECNFELATANELARLQGFAALGCALLAGGGYLLLRRKN